MSEKSNITSLSPFNGPVEIGLRALAILSDAFPMAYSLQSLVIFDYLVVHSDDIPGGPAGLHPQTPDRSGELLVRRSSLNEGLLLYQSRGLVERHFETDGVYYGATEQTADFLDTLTAQYILWLRDRASWLIGAYGNMSEGALQALVREHQGQWGAEFRTDAELWTEESS